MKTLHYVKIKRERVGICNICGTEAVLSWDHVPPKGSIICDDVEVLSIANNFIKIQKPPKVLSQNGMKFRTICSKCNSLIGGKYDVIFNSFISTLIGLICKNKGNEKHINANVNVEMLIKSVFGHMLAAKGENENTVPDTKMKGYLLGNEDISDLKVHYWFYPYVVNQVIRDVLIHKIQNRQNAFVSILKLFPIAFLVTNSDMFMGTVPVLNDYSKTSNGENAIVKLDLSLVYDYQWPIISDEDTILAGGQSINSAVMAVPRLKIK